MKKILSIIALAMLVMAPAAIADSISIGPGDPCGSLANDCGPLTFTIDATSTTATLTISNGSSSDWQLHYFSLNLYSNNITATGSLSQNGTIQIVNDTQGNNGQGDCNVNGPKPAFCVNILTGGIIGGNGSITYTFDIDNGTLLNTDDWHIQALVTEVDGKGRVALSTGPGGGGEVPEPASMILLGSGLLGSGRMIRKRLKK
jgi:hypothetical protein